MAAERMRRVNEAIRQVIADALAGELADPRLGFVTVTDVKTSPDLRSARVFVSVLGSSEVRADSLAALDRAHGVLQSQIATQLSLKRTPRLQFEYDATTDRALRVETLLREGAE
ncbi:MAG TPA: 30S ribosome-binding factor RbfA [Solirubrobacteraceae bacterium]|jgi:ribosome-binding factor A|nr:30S ribosome-binding factor RbfA [Solirubrobacteraceae bacterium]